jgi:glutathione S-transferase
MTFRLINARPSPYGRKVAVVLEEKGLPYEVQYDTPWVPGTCVGDYNPLEQLPILLTETGEAVYDSPYIVEWLETRFPEPALLPADVDGRLEARKRQMLAERLLDFCAVLMFESKREHPSQPWYDRHASKVVRALTELDRLYASPVPGKLPLDLGDIAVVTTLDLLEFVVADGVALDLAEMRWRGLYPALTELSERLNRRPSFSRTVPQHMDMDMSNQVG